jgi:hypothetical protein
MKTPQTQNSKNRYVIRKFQHYSHVRSPTTILHRENGKVKVFTNLEEAKKLRFGSIYLVGKSLKDLKIVGTFSNWHHKGYYDIAKENRLAKLI